MFRNTSKTITFTLFNTLFHFNSVLQPYHLANRRSYFENFSGEKISTTKIDQTKIKPVLNSIHLRYINTNICSAHHGLLTMCSFYLTMYSSHHFEKSHQTKICLIFYFPRSSKLVFFFYVFLYKNSPLVVSTFISGDIHLAD